MHTLSTLLHPLHITCVINATPILCRWSILYTSFVVRHRTTLSSSFFYHLFAIFFLKNVFLFFSQFFLELSYSRFCSGSLLYTCQINYIHDFHRNAVSPLDKYIEDKSFSYLLFLYSLSLKCSRAGSSSLSPLRFLVSMTITLTLLASS